ncbi:threonine--tRNA ligase [Candidatus Gracilibacteria bacterium]|nr:threonine--tRNA ligase [Candidatus Gracilibacteria bacterium]
MSKNDLEIRRRHTASHLMTKAIEMCFPDTKIHLGVGPWTDEGFYQDFDFGETKFSTDDFKKVEKKMRWLVNKNFKITRFNTDYETAKKECADDKFKTEILEDLKNAGETNFSFYDFVDDSGRIIFRNLCAGPHLASTGEVGVFKLTKCSAAFWRGDARRESLTRVYGVAFPDNASLETYENFLEEAAKRDHRKLGVALDLFTFSEKVGAGLPLFTPKGAFLRNKIEQTITDIQEKFGFEKVHIPHITKKDLYETSGHWEKFKEDLFHVKGKHGAEFVMKPMNCPHHTQIYASQMRSYRDLPIRYVETTTCYRDEQPGELLGLSRVRSLTQDDGHVFCTIAQIKQESKNIVEVIRQFYTKLDMFGEDNFCVSLSVRDPKTPEKYLGKTENWDKAEQFLEEIAEEEGLKYKRIEGEAAFYGPKLDFQFKDAIGRDWQLATVQIDFVQPERFDLEYINEKGGKSTPVMIHRAVAGSLERFLSLIIEHFAGAFPVWLAPVQAHILPVNKKHEDFAYDLAKKIKENGGRIEIYPASETLGKRIRNAQTQKVPFSIVIGDNEIQEKNLTIRKYGEQKDSKITLDAFMKILSQ